MYKEMTDLSKSAFAPSNNPLAPPSLITSLHETPSLAPAMDQSRGAMDQSRGAVDQSRGAMDLRPPSSTGLSQPHVPTTSGIDSFFKTKARPVPQQRVNPQTKRTRKQPTSTYKGLSEQQKTEAYFEMYDSNLSLKKSHKALEAEVRVLEVQLKKISQSAKYERELAESYTGKDFKSSHITAEDNRTHLERENKQLKKLLKEVSGAVSRSKNLNLARSIGPLLVKYGYPPQVLTGDLYSIAKHERSPSPQPLRAASPPLAESSTLILALQTEVDSLRKELSTERLKGLELESKLRLLEAQGAPNEHSARLHELHSDNKRLEQQLRDSLRNPFAADSEKQISSLRERIYSLESELSAVQLTVSASNAEKETLKEKNMELAFLAKNKDNTFRELDEVMKRMGERDLNDFLRQLGIMKINGEQPAWAKLDFLERSVQIPTDTVALTREVERLQLEKGELAAQLEKVHTLVALGSEKDKEQRALNAVESAQLRMKLQVAEQRAEELARLADFRASRVIQLEKNQRLNVYDESNRIIGSKTSIMVGQYESSAAEFVETDTQVGSDENILDLWVGEAEYFTSALASVLYEELPGESNFVTFATVDFFNHETQTTSLCEGFRPKYNIHISFKVPVDEHFIEYLSREYIYIETTLAHGDSQATLALSKVPLKELLQRATAEANTKAAVIESTVILYSSADGRTTVGSLLYKLRMRYPLSEAVRWHQEKQEVIELANPKQYALDIVHRSQPIVPARCLNISIFKALGLVSSVHPGHLRPFVFFQFFTEPETITHTSIGADPVYDSTYHFSLSMSPELRRYLDTSSLEVIVIDDNAPVRQGGQDVIGVAHIPLSSLLLDSAAEGTYALFNNRGQQVGGLSMKVAWKDSLPDTVGYGTPLTEAWHKDTYGRIAKALVDRGLSMDSAFSVFDQDQDGLVSASEFRNTLLITLRLPLSEQEVQLLLNTCNLVDGGIPRTLFRQLFHGLLTYSPQAADQGPSAEANLLQKVREAIKQRKMNIWKVVDVFDIDRDGFISHSEFRRAFSAMKLGLSANEVERLLTEFDPQNNGKIDFETFCQNLDMNWEEGILSKVRERVHVKKLNLRQAFDAFDQDHNGVINYSEFQEAFRTMQLGLSELEVRRLLKHFDPADSGQIDYRTFCSKLNIETPRSAVHWEESVIEKIRQRIHENNLDLTAAFNAFDKDHDGSISHSEFREAFKVLGFQLSTGETERMLGHFDPHKSGRIDFRAFCAIIHETVPENSWEETVLLKIKQRIQEKNLSLREAFDAFDRDKNGRVSHAEFKETFRTMELGLSESEIARMINFFDIQGRGVINYRSFQTALDKVSAADSWEESVISRVRQRITTNNLDLRKGFQAFDADGNGRIDRSEFRKTFQAMEFGLRDTEIDRMFRAFDRTDSGSVDYRTFCNRLDESVTPHRTEPQWEQQILERVRRRIAEKQLDLRKGFGVFDRNKDGRISKDEFVRAFQQMEFGLSTAEIERMLLHFDPGHRGSIDFRTFCAKIEGSQ